MKSIILLLLLCLISYGGRSQEEVYCVNKYDFKVYKRIKDGLKSPMEVYILDLSIFTDADFKKSITRGTARTFLEKITLFKNLRELRIDVNILEYIPESIALLSKLETVRITRNIESRVQNNFDWVNAFAILANVKTLRTLVVGRFQNLRIPREIEQLKNLQSLVIRGGDLASLPVEISNLSDLKDLKLDDTGQMSFVKDFTGLRNLNTLSVISNASVDYRSLLQSLANSSIKKLAIVRAGLVELPEEIGSLTSLRELDLSDNNLRTLPISIARLESLREIRLRTGNDLGDLPSDFEAKVGLIRLPNGNFVRTKAD